MVALSSSRVFGDSYHCPPFSGFGNSFVGSRRIFLNPNTTKLAKDEKAHLAFLPSVELAPSVATDSGWSSPIVLCVCIDVVHDINSTVAFVADPKDKDVRNQVSRLKASSNSPGLAQELINYKVKNVGKTDGGQDLFGEMKQRFLNFKEQKYIKELEHFQALAEVQYPKFMVIACADSRVCPSNILGFQPGEAFMIRNVANLVPPLENGPTETNAALEFAVNTLEVGNILVIGHSSCAGIQALMSMQDDVDSRSFVEKWVIKGKVAKLRTKADAAHFSFDQQCRHCEKESVNRSLLNLLTYPWIQERVRKGLLSIHGGYYDFLNCTFEKWTLDLKGSSIGEEGSCSVKDQAFWC